MNIGYQIERNMLPSDSLIVDIYADALIMSKASLRAVKTKQFERIITNE